MSNYFPIFPLTTSQYDNFEFIKLLSEEQPPQSRIQVNELYEFIPFARSHRPSPIQLENIRSSFSRSFNNNLTTKGNIGDRLRKIPNERISSFAAAERLCRLASSESIQFTGWSTEFPGLASSYKIYVSILRAARVHACPLLPLHTMPCRFRAGLISVTSMHEDIAAGAHCWPGCVLSREGTRLLFC